MKTPTNWKPFFFEANQFFDFVRSPEDWQKLRDAYPHYSDGRLLEAQEATYGGTRPQEEREAHPNYGFRSEHDGERTLAMFFESSGMQKPNQQ